jgi:nucleoid-associated protein EbfC
MFKGLAGLGSLVRHAQQMGERMQKLNEELRNRRATGNAGGEMVEVEVNGLLEVLRCTINPQLIEDQDRELLEDLVVAAVNQALTKGRQLHADALKEMTGGLELPGLEETLGKILGGGRGGDSTPS